MPGTERHSISKIIPVLVCLLLPLLPFAGSSFIHPADIFRDGVDQYIFWNLRLPRVIAACLAGGALSLGGLCFQGLFRNSLATPYTLGISGGAALGAAVAVQLGAVFTFAGQGVMTISAFAGALLSAILVFTISRISRSSKGETMLLAGVAVSLLCSSIIMFIQYLADSNRLFQTVRWMMGGMAVSGFSDLALLAPVCIISATALLRCTKELDLLSIDSDFAAARGVDVRRTGLFIFLWVSLMAGAVVSVCGPIGFVGLVCPHICRRLGGIRHSELAPASILFGAAFLAICDTLARSIIPPVEIPAGIITSLLGTPFFIMLLAKRRA